MIRIFMLSNHPLFCEGVFRLLQQESQIDFVGRTADEEQALEQIRVLRPDAVIIDTSDVFAKVCSLVATIFDEKLGTVIVGLNLNNNMMCIYREEKKEFRGIKDLMSALAGGDRPADQKESQEYYRQTK